MHLKELFEQIKREQKQGAKARIFIVGGATAPSDKDEIDWLRLEMAIDEQYNNGDSEEQS